MNLVVTASEFKAQFPRFSPEYLPIYITGSTHFNGDIVYYSDTGLFYQCVVKTTTNSPSNTTDWDLYSDDVLNYTRDSDILEAIAEASVNFNESLFSDETTAKSVFLYLAAHYLTVDFKNALGTNQIGMVTSKSVGSVSEGYSIPDWIMKNSALAPYATTGYGIKYATLLRPYLVGNIMIFKGRSTID